MHCLYESGLNRDAAMTKAVLQSPWLAKMKQGA